MAIGTGSTMRTLTTLALAAAAVLTGCAKGLAPGATALMPGTLRAREAAADLAAPFPDGFLWGVATAGHQIEGGDKTSNWAAWEKAGRVAHPIGKAIDFWNRYEADLDLAQSLGLKAFRLSLEWAKIEPQPGVIDAEAVQRYHAILAAVRARGMEPIVTVVHFTYPAWLDAAAGPGRSAWESDKMPVEFARFAGWAAQEFGADVTWWLTINEPNTYAMVGYLAGMMPPGKINPFAYMAVMGNLVKAHKLGYDAIHASDADAQVSINPIMIHQRPDDPLYKPGPDLPTEGLMPRSPGMGGSGAPESGPIVANGGFYVDETTFLDEFMPPRTPAKGKPAPEGKRYLDYCAFNYFYAVKPTEVRSISNYGKWPIYPDGMYQVAKKLHARYQLPLMVTENGMPTVSDNPRVDGWTREAYLLNHLAHMRRAMAEGVPMLGYMHWTLVDNYEWGSYEPKFGLFGVDRRDPELRRFRTPGADMYEAIVKGNRLPEPMLARFAGRRS